VSAHEIIYRETVDNCRFEVAIVSKSPTGKKKKGSKKKTK
jgi:hypothetical protein